MDTRVVLDTAMLLLLGEKTLREHKLDSVSAYSTTLTSLLRSFGPNVIGQLTELKLWADLGNGYNVILQG